MLQPNAPQQPTPQGRVWSAAYADAETECFELRTLPEGREEGVRLLYHKEYPVGTAIGDFLETDLSIWDQMKGKVRDAVESIGQGRYLKKSFHTVFYCTLYWLDRSAFFVPLAATLQRLHLRHAAGERVSLEEYEDCLAYYRALQDRLRDLTERVFSAPEGESTARRYFALQKEYGEEAYPSFSFSALEYRTMAKGLRGGTPYDEFLEEDEEPGEPEMMVATVLETEDPRVFSEFLICRYLQEDQHLRRCKYCGRYFASLGRGKVEFCDRLIENSNKTCREMGALRLYERRMMENPAIREYRRSYKTHNARIRYGLMTREDFERWSAEARRRRDQCLAGELSLEDYVAWLKSDKPKK